MASMTLDRNAYGTLLAKELPTRIHNDDEYGEALRRTRELLLHEDEATPEELEYLDLLTILVREYERKRWPRKREKSSPREILKFLMDENGLKQSDLADIAPQSNISAILAGKRPIGKATALKLAKRFRVDASLFL